MRVSAALKPSRWVPPSRLLMVLVKEKICSAVAVVPLQRDLAALLRTAVAFLDVLEEDRLRVERALVAVQVLDEGGDAAGVGELGLLVGALVLRGGS